jgi:hypothetical protein
MMRFLSRWLAHWRNAPADQPSHDATIAMSGMAPMLDCEQVMRQLWDYLDEELADERMEAIRAHLELCKRCYPQYEFERSFLDAVAGSAREHANIERLRARLALSLQEKGMTGV